MPFVTITRRWFGGQDTSAWSRSFDAVEVEDHTFETEIPDSPLDIGISVSDHAFDHPVKLSVTAAVSDLPPLGKADDVFAAQGPTRGLAAYAWLRQLQKAHEPFSVQTGLELFSAMMITSLRVKKDAAHANILYFTAELKEIVWVSTQVVLYPAQAKKRAAAKKKDEGDKGQAETDDALKKKAKKSLLKIAADYVLGATK